MSQPFLSVLTPTYNRAHYVRDALTSALTQDYPHFEVILVDDGSTDDTLKLARSLDDPKLQCVEKSHSGAPDTRNHCIDKASGDFVVWLDSDDVMLPGVLSHYASLLHKYPDVDILYGDLAVFSDTEERGKMTFADHYSEPNIVSKIIRGNLVPNPGTLVKKDLYTTHGGYDLRFRRAHDFEFWSRVLPTSTLKHCGRTVVRYRCHEDNMSLGKFDMSFEAGILKRLVHRHGLRALFPDFDWSSPDTATSDALQVIGNLLKSCNDVDNAMVAFRHAMSITDTSREAELLLFAMDALALQTELEHIEQSNIEAEFWKIGKGYVEDLDPEKFFLEEKPACADTSGHEKTLKVNVGGFINKNSSENIFSDFSAESVQNVDLFNLTEKDLSAIENTFDSVEIGEALTCVKNLEHALETLYSILKPGGRLVVDVPHDLSHNAWSNPRVVRCFSENSWNNIPGFRVSKINSRYSSIGENLLDSGLDPMEILIRPRAVDSLHVELNRVY
ncbi:MAG: glycosyltransferase [Granulosicoccus sp.]|nr:glycosyltransferase [Granulosicoccus sp.]